MAYQIRLAEKSDLYGLCRLRNNKDLFKHYFEKSPKDFCFVVAEQESRILGFGVLKWSGSKSPKLSDLYVGIDH